MASTTWWQDYLTNKLTETFVCRDTSLDHEPVPSTDRGLITYNSNDAADELEEMELRHKQQIDQMEERLAQKDSDMDEALSRLAEQMRSEQREALENQAAEHASQQAGLRAQLTGANEEEVASAAAAA